jgi:tRNA threonylcarbamoyladenosine biosynthesis protein TsaB
MILLIDTSQETGTAALSQDGHILLSEENRIAKEHASWLHPAIGRLLSSANKTVRDLEAVSVVAGPGSYTGLRVGLAAAKGLCYALKIPLITQNTLEVMAESMRSAALEKSAETGERVLICPMIDARRDEVFTAIYDSDPSTIYGHRSSVIENPSTVNRQPLTNIGHRSSVIYRLSTTLPAQALILDKNSFERELTENSILFFGSGAAKWQKITLSPRAIFEPQRDMQQAFAILSQQGFEAGLFADLIYAEPIYLKEFFSY